MPNSLLMETAAEIGARRIFVDGIGSLFPALNGGKNTPITGPGSYRELLQQLLDALERQNLTAILTHELGSFPESRLTCEMACSLVDTVIQLNRSSRNRQSIRGIEIIKSRGQRYETGEHTFSLVALIRERRRRRLEVSGGPLNLGHANALLMIKMVLCRLLTSCGWGVEHVAAPEHPPG